MSLSDLIPLITGGGGALIVLMVGVWLLLTEKLVPGTTHKRALNLLTKLEDANDVLQHTIEAERDQKQQLIGGAQLANQLAGALVELARGGRPAVPVTGDGQGGP